MAKKSKSAKQKSTSKQFTDDKSNKRLKTGANGSTAQTLVEAPSLWTKDILVSTAVGCLLLALYVKTLFPSIPGGDSGELIVSAHELGVAHPPGYPLFTLASKLAMLAIPWGSPAWRVNLLNAVFSAGAGTVLLLTMLRLTCCIGSSVAAVALFSLSQLTWTWSITAEVFGLNNFFIASLLLLTTCFYKSNDSGTQMKLCYLGALVSGLTLCNQHTAVLYVACIILWVLFTLQQEKLLSISVILKLGCCFIVGLLPYIYLPIASSMSHARWTWGDQSTLEGFLRHFLRFEYGTFDLGKDQEGQGFFHGLSEYGLHSFYNLAYIGLPLAAVGATVSFKQYKSCDSVPAVFPVMLIVYACFFAWRANLDTTNELLMGVVTRFWMQSDVVVCLLAGCGLHYLNRGINSVNVSIGAVIPYIAAVIITAVQLSHFPKMDQSGNVLVRDFAQSLFDALPKNALVLTKGDLPTNSMRYLHLVEGKRPDLVVLDQEILSYQWSLPVLRRAHPQVMFPGDFWHLRDMVWQDGRRSFTFKTFLDANYKKFAGGIFVCIGMHDRDPSWQQHYMLWPHGVCHQVKRQGEGMDPYTFAKETGHLAYEWTYPFEGYDNTSWEKVANDEMWQAKISTAFFMYQQGVAAPDPSSQVHLLISAYQLYKAAINHHSAIGFPVFWHKNHALVCEKLLHLEHDLSKPELAQESIDHFQAYLGTSPDDPDTDKIREALKVLKDRKKMLEGMQDAHATTERVMDRMDKLRS